MRRIALSIALIAAAVGTAPAEEPMIPVPDSIRAEGVPPIPKSLAAALNRYQNIRGASFQGWDDEGGKRAVYVTTRFGDTTQVHYVASPGGARRQLTFLSERVLGVVPRPRRAGFLFASDEGGAENYQFFLRPRDRDEVVRVTPEGSRNLSPKWSPEGDLLAWSGNARDGVNMDLYVAAPSDPALSRRVREVAGQWTVSDWSPDGKTLAVEEYLSITESRVHLVDLATGNVRTIPEKPSSDEARAAVAGPRFSADGKSLLYVTDRGAEFRRLVQCDLATGVETILSGDVPWDVEEFDLSDDGKKLVAAINEDGRDSPHVFNPIGSDFRHQGFLALPEGRIAGLKFRRGEVEFGYALDSARSPSDVYSQDAGTMARVRWTESETGGLDPSTFAEPELIRYRSFDGREIPAFVYRPARASGPSPVLISIHGGPESQFRPGFIGRMNHLINELGIVVISPNVRGSSGYGKSYLKMDDGLLREDSVKDIGALLDWIAARPELDKSRVAVSGGSYGGFMSLAVQTTYNDRIKCGIDVVGISNFVTFLENTRGYRRDLRRAEYGDERDPKIREFLQRISPLTHADKIKNPILVIQGANDPRVPLSESDQLVAAVRKNEVPVWYVVGLNEGHGFSRKVNQDYQQAVEVRFLMTHLLGDGAAAR